MGKNQPEIPPSSLRRAFSFGLYLAIRTFAALLLGLPEFLLRGAVDALVPIAHFFDARHRQRARRHLSEAGYSKGDSRVLARRMFGHFAIALLESLLMRRKLTARTWKQFVRLENWHLIAGALRGNRGALCIGCHEGNWELAGFVTSLLGLSHTTIARTFSNPWLDQWLNGDLRTTERRLMAGQEGGIRQVTRALRENRVGVLLADQNAGRGGIFVPFFGRSASTSPTPAVLSIRTGAPILPFYTYREGPSRYVIGIHPDVAPVATGCVEDDVRRLTGWMTMLFERSIRLHPEQWIWSHRRWYSTPSTTS